jgi:hypothetical protein
MNTVTVRKEANTEYTVTGAVVRIDARSKDEKVRYRQELPTEIKTLIEGALEEYRAIYSQMNEIDVYASPENEDEWMALKVEARELITEAEKVASAMLTLPVFEQYRQEKEYKPGWTFYRLKDEFGYDVASTVMPKEE